MAKGLVLGLAVAVREELLIAVKSRGGVQKWYDDNIRGPPWLIPVEGKAKGDYYKIPKTLHQQLRFYNCLPR